jgi:hypothetical protein
MHSLPSHQLSSSNWQRTTARLSRFVLRTLLLAALLFFSASHTPVLADENFTTAVKTTYTVQLNGTTTVSHQFSVSNNTPTTYLKQYALQTSNQDLQQVSAISEDSPLEPEIKTSGQSTSITLNFPTEVVGQGKKRTFSISYEVKGLATVGGSVLELKLPKLSSGEQFDSRSVTVITPVKFGGPVRVSRQPDTTQSDTATFTAVFNNLGSDALSLFYGESQTFKMTLRYNLENPSSSRGIAQIALPPDTPLQKMQYHELDPLPKQMKRDDDGNWIATYELAPQTASTVYLTAYAHLTLEPNLLVPQSAVLPQHTQAQKYWETQDRLIQEKAASFTTAQAAFTHVVETLNYSQELANQPSIERRGAVAAFTDPTLAICQEYADAFIATARAANIPTRRLTGYAFTQDNASRPLSLSGDVLHAWAEYFDSTSNRWIQVDPTWQDTTGGVDYFNQFDLNHIVFAINGISSVTPYPAGSYKTTDASKDVEVSFADSFPETTPAVTLKLQPETVFGVQIPGLYRLLLTNTTGQAWYDTQVAYTQLKPSVALQGAETNISALLPFQTIEIPLHLKNSNWFSFDTSEFIITATTHGVAETYETTARSGPAYVTAIFHPRFLPYLGAGLVVSTLAAGSVLVFRRKR